MKATYKITNPVFRPKTGRPSETGLSVRELGRKKYDQLYWRTKRSTKTQSA